MRHSSYERDGDQVTELDREGIDDLIEGLERLRECQPGEELYTPSFVTDDDGSPLGVGDFVLRRAPDEGGG